MLDLNAFAKEVHAVSVAHGWWEKDDPDNNPDTKVALIHAEWSEALEEYRAGRPMVWYGCKARVDGKVVCCEPSRCRTGMTSDPLNCEGCVHRDSKPEGIAVELIDGVLRIMDMCEGIGAKVDWQILRQHCERRMTWLRDDMRFGTLIGAAHTLTTETVVTEDAVCVVEAAALVLAWIAKQGTDPWELLRIKHEYNKMRPYKHGGKKC